MANSALRRYACVLITGAIALFKCAPLSATDVQGTVSTNTQQTATVTTEGDLVPNVGDPASIFFKMAGAEDEISVATGKVSAVNGNSVEVAIDNATGFVNAGQLVRFASQNPQKRSAATGPSPVATAAPPNSSDMTQGLADLKNNNLDGAIAALSKEIQINPTNAAAYHWRAVAHLQKGQLDDCIGDCNIAISLASRALSYALRGGARIQKKDYRAAIDDETRAIGGDPKLAVAYAQRAGARLFLHESDPTILTDCNQALALDPKASDAYFFRGWYYAITGARQAAEGDWQKAVALRPSLNTGIQQARSYYFKKKSGRRRR